MCKQKSMVDEAAKIVPIFIILHTFLWFVRHFFFTSSLNAQRFSHSLSSCVCFHAVCQLLFIIRVVTGFFIYHSESKKTKTKNKIWRIKTYDINGKQKFCVRVRVYRKVCALLWFNMIMLICTHLLSPLTKSPLLSAIWAVCVVCVRVTDGCGYIQTILYSEQSARKENCFAACVLSLLLFLLTLFFSGLFDLYTLGRWQIRECFGNNIFICVTTFSANSQCCKLTRGKKQAYKLTHTYTDPLILALSINQYTKERKNKKMTEPFKLVRYTNVLHFVSNPRHRS